MNYTQLSYLMNEKYTVAEIKLSVENEKNHDLSVNNYWLSISDKGIERLPFISMKEEMINGNMISVRVFKNAELRFDKLFSKFSINNEIYILKNCSEEKIPKDIDEKILQFLKEA